MRQGYRGFDAGTIPTDGPFLITFRLENGHQWYNKGWYVGMKPPADWTAYLAEKYGTGFFTVWSQTKKGQFGRFIVTEADVLRAQAATPPPQPTTPPADADTRRKLKRQKRRIMELEAQLADLEAQLAELEDDDDPAPNPGPQTIAEQLDQARRDAEAAKAYNAAINPPAPPAFDLAKMVQALAPIVAPLVQQQLAKQQEATKPPTPPAVAPEWLALVQELQQQGADPAALLQNVRAATEANP